MKARLSDTEMGIVKIDITSPLPEEGVVNSTYAIEGTAKMFDAVGALPWVYAEVKLKSWIKPEVIEETSYERGFPVPITGEFKIDWVPKKEGVYEVTVIATPAPLSLPVVGVEPITGKSDMMRVTVGKLAPQAKGLRIVSYDSTIPPTKLTVAPGDKLKVYIAFEYQGPAHRETLYAALWKGYIFGHPDETAPAKAAIDIPECLEPRTISGSEVYVTITIPNRPSEVFGLYAKVGPVECEPADRYKDNIEVSGVPVEVWEMVEEIPGITIKPGVPVEVWEMVEEIPRITIKPSVPVEVWEMVEEVSGITVKSKPIAPPTGTFEVALRDSYALYGIVEWCGEWEADGISYITPWVKKGVRVKVQASYGEPVPLIGQFSAWLWYGEGDAIKYGPSPLCQLEDRRIYGFSLGDLKLYY